MSYKKLDNPTEKLLSVKCRCGHSITFTTNYQRTCNYCGRLVYPTKKLEFKERLKKEMRKIK